MKKKLTALLMVSLMVVGLIAGCAQKTEEPAAGGEASSGSEEAAGGGESAAGILMALNSDFWHMMESGIINGGVENNINIKVTGPTNEADVTGQLSMIEDQITAGAKGLVIAPCEPKALIPLLEQAKEKGIPVVLVDSDMEEENHDLRATFIGISEYEAGEKVGEYIVENFEPCKIAVIRGLAGLPSHDARANGMRDVVTKEGFEVVAELPADSERGKAVGVAENIISATPDVGIIYCTNDEMALGAFQAVEGKQKQDDIFVIGFDGSPDALKSIQEGKLGATLAQSPILIGQKAVEALRTIFDGGTVENNVFTETQMIDKNNAADFEKDLNEQIEKAEATK